MNPLRGSLRPALMKLRSMLDKRLKHAGKLFPPKLPAILFARSRSAMRQGARPDAASSTGDCGAPIRQDWHRDVSEVEVVTVCSWQFPERRDCRARR